MFWIYRINLLLDDINDKVNRHQFNWFRLVQRQLPVYTEENSMQFLLLGQKFK